jgi:hypothetical protein
VGPVLRYMNSRYTSNVILPLHGRLSPVPTRLGRAGRKSVQITGARRSGRGPDYVAEGFFFAVVSIITCRLYK